MQKAACGFGGGDIDGDVPGRSGFFRIERDRQVGDFCPEVPPSNADHRDLLAFGPRGQRRREVAVEPVDRPDALSKLLDLALEVLVVQAHSHDGQLVAEGTVDGNAECERLRVRLVIGAGHHCRRVGEAVGMLDLVVGIAS